MLPLLRIGEQLVQPLGEVLWVFRAVEQSALRFGQDLRERAVVGLHNGNAGRERL